MNEYSVNVQNELDHESATMGATKTMTGFNAFRRGTCVLSRIFGPFLSLSRTVLLIAALSGSLWIQEASAAVTFQAAGTAVGSQASVTAAWPAHQAGDVALLFVETAGGETPPMTTPSGFVLVANSPQTTGAGTAGTKLSVYWARATSSSMADVVIGDAGDHTAAQILTFRGVVSTGNPWSATGGGVKGTAAANVTVPGVTTTVPNCMVVVAVTHDMDAASTTTWSGWTNTNLVGLVEQADYGTSGGTGGGFGVATGTKATAGATGNTTATVASTTNAFMTIALAPEPTVTWSAASQASTSETVPATMTVTASLNQASIAAVAVPFTVTGTATGGSDYTITPASSLNIPALSTSASATITLIGDTIDEPNQTVILTMGTPTGASLGATTVHTATIIDDDAPPSVQWTAASQASPNETNGTTMTVTAQLSAATEVGAVSIPYTLSGTAANGTDYTLAPVSPLIIDPGATTAVATITIVGDLIIESGGETVILTIGASPTNATRGAVFTHTATITDDDTNSTIAGTMSYSSITESGMTVTVSFAGDNNGNNTCALQAYTDSGRTIPYGGSLAMTRSPVSGAGPGTFSVNVTGLTGGTTFYFRATYNDINGYTAGSTVDGTSSTKYSPLMHVRSNNSERYTTNQWGTGYTCATCHQANSTNIKRVRTTVGGTGLINNAGTPITGNPLSLTAADGASATFADNATTNKTCDSCHGDTSIYKRGVANATSGSPLMITGASPPHPADPACNQCHLHNRGFKAVGGCILCHEVGNTYQAATSAPTILDNTGAALRGEAYGGHLRLTVGENLASVTDWDARCQACHDGHYAMNGVRIPENPTVGIDYVDGYIDLGGTATLGNTEAEICWNCHDGVSVSEWGTNTDTNSTATNYNFGTVYTDASKNTQTSKWIGTYWVSANFSYKEGWLNNKPTTADSVTGTANAGSTHAVSSGGVQGIDAVANIRCTYCHDVHNTANLKGTVAGDVHGKPYLRGSWKGNPYNEDGAPRSGVTYTANNGYGLVPRAGSVYTDMGGYFIDQNTTVTPNSLGWVAGGSTGFGGLCELCHGNADNSFTVAEINALNKFGTASDSWIGSNGHSNSVKGGDGSIGANIFRIADRNSVAVTFGTAAGVSAGSPAMGNVQNSANWVYSFRSVSSRATQGFNVQPYATTEQIPNAGTTWGVTINSADTTVDLNYHKFSCSKCHTPHASRLPRLMITNCLDTKNNTWANAYIVPSASTVVNGSSPSIDNASMPISQATSAQNCHRVRNPAYANSRGAGWNKVTPW